MAYQNKNKNSSQKGVRSAKKKIQAKFKKAPSRKELSPNSAKNNRATKINF